MRMRVDETGQNRGFAQIFYGGFGKLSGNFIARADGNDLIVFDGDSAVFERFGGNR